MKTLLFYNKYSFNDIQLKERAEMVAPEIELIEINSQSHELRKYVRETPALFVFRDDFQGEFLNQEGVDSLTAIKAVILQSKDLEEKNVYNQDNQRLDSFINFEKEKSKKEGQDEMTLELIEGGIL